MQAMQHSQSSGEKNSDLSALKETVVSQDVSSVPIDDVRQELETTRAALADALAKLEDDDNVVVKWEGASRGSL